MRKTTRIVLGAFAAISILAATALPVFGNFITLRIDGIYISIRSGPTDWSYANPSAFINLAPMIVQDEILVSLSTVSGLLEAYTQWVGWHQWCVWRHWRIDREDWCGWQRLHDQYEEISTSFISRGETNIELTIGSNTAVIDGQDVDISVPVRIVNRQLFVPLLFIAESLGFDIEIIILRVCRLIHIKEFALSAHGILCLMGLSIFFQSTKITQPHFLLTAHHLGSLSAREITALHLLTRLFMESGNDGFLTTVRYFNMIPKAVCCDFLG